MHSVSSPIPITQDEPVGSFGESAEMLGFPVLPDTGNAFRSSDGAVIENAAGRFPIPKVCGECIEASVGVVGGRLFVTNYRIVITDSLKRSVASIPVVGVESVEAKESCSLQITCRYGRVYKVTVLNSECACEWYKRLSQKTVSTRNVWDVFAWEFAKFAKSEATWLTFKKGSCDTECPVKDEFDRLGYNIENWRISEANTDFSICETYPQKTIVPKSVKDEELRFCAEARTLSRFPTAVWHCKEKETVLMRSSQPRVGFFSYRYEHDERLIEYVRAAVPKVRSTTLLIIDARSYAAVLGNRAKGGGVELPDYYKQTEVEYMSLPNIHNIRYAFHQLRAMLQNKSDMQFHVTLQNTNWLPYLYSLIDSAFRCVRALRDEGRSVLVHCSDGWDRTTQITTLAKIIADPYYRTFKGFRALIQRDWIDFGHKFRDRLGILNKNPDEVSPVFLQWLDCVYQLHQLHIAAFEFSTFFLTQLAMHAYSGLFGTFLWNSLHEKKKYQLSVDAETLSVWSYFDKKNPSYINFMYNPCTTGRLASLNGLVDLVLWKELYLCSRTEQLVNEPDSKFTGSIIGEGSRSSLYRSHSAESVANADGSNHASSSLLSGDKGQSYTLQPVDRVEEVTSFRQVDSGDFCDSQNLLEERFPGLVDRSGLPRVDDVMEEVRIFMEKVLKEQEDKLRTEYERKLLQKEQGRFSSSGNPNLSGSSGELNILNGSFSLAEEDSENSSLNSFTSAEWLSKDEVPENYDGCKGQMVHGALKYCMGCARHFWWSWGHHCRCCGGLFCSNCLRHKYYSMHDSKGGQVRACETCYTKMLADTYDSSSSQNTPTQSILVRE